MPSDDAATVCDQKTGKQSAFLPHSSGAMARTVLEKLTRLSLTNKLTDDQTKAIVALGSQLLQTTSSSMPAACRTQSAATQSQASIAADVVVRQTVSRVRKELTGEGAPATAAVWSTASMLADTVIQQSLREISNDLMTSDILRPKALVAGKSLPPTVAACPPGACTELTKFIVMNAIDIALSCARRAAAAKQTRTDGSKSPVVGATSDHRTPDGSNLVDVFVDRLSNEVYGDLSETTGNSVPAAVLAMSRRLDEDLRRQCLALTSSPPPLPSSSRPDDVDPFAEVLMNLALHDRFGDLQKNFVDGREMMELATCVLKSHVQSRKSDHVPDDAAADKTSSIGTY